MLFLKLHPFLYALTILSFTLGGCNKVKAPLTVHNTFVTPQAGKDYLVITDPNSGIIPKAMPQQEVHVIEFFSYACHACYEIEPSLSLWLKKQPNFVKFERIPLSYFNREGEALARLYYLTRMLGKEQLLMPVIFKRIQKEHKTLTDAQSIKQFLLENNISQTDYNIAMSFQRGLDSQLARGTQLEQLYQIMAVPTLVIGGRYKVDIDLLGGNIDRYFEVTTYLIEKVKKGED